MKKIKAFIITLFTFYIITGLSLFAQKVPEPMIKAFSNGDVEILSNYLNDRLQVNIRDQEFMCSKAQAKEIMRDFFNKNKPGSFKIIFEGGKEDSNFSIGTLVTSSGNYRVNIFFKKFGNNNLVHLLRIEKDDGRAF